MESCSARPPQVLSENSSTLLRAFVMVVVSTALITAAVLAIISRVTNPVDLLANWPQLPDIWQGKTIEVTNMDGFYWHPLTEDSRPDRVHGTLILNGAVQGDEIEVNPPPASSSPGDYPVEFIGDGDAISQARAKNAIVAGYGVPRLTLALVGEQVVAHIVPDAHTRNWVLLGDTVTTQENRLSFNPDTSSAYLLWNSDRDPADAFRHEHAVRLSLDSKRVMKISSLVAQPARGRIQVQFIGGGERRKAWLAAGKYSIPKYADRLHEDHALYQAATQAGLIHFQDGHLHLIPADARRATYDHWPPITDKNDKLFESLYGSAAGAGIRRQIRMFNEGQQWAGIKLLGSDVSESLGVPTAWTAEADAQQLSLEQDMPGIMGRFYLPGREEESRWLRVKGLNGSTQTKVRLTAGIAARQYRRFGLVVLGQVTGIWGGKIISQTSACLAAASCRQEMLSHLVVEQNAGDHLVLEIIADRHFAGLNPLRSTGAVNLELKDGQVIWKAGRPARMQENHGRTEVTILNRNREVLFADGQPTAIAVASGLAPLVGLDDNQANSISGVLRNHGDAPQIESVLTIDGRVQRIVHQLLDCIGYREGEWDAGKQQCLRQESVPVGRTASFIMLDAVNGDILAASNFPYPNDLKNTAEWIRYDSYNPERSLLRQPWHHTGNTHSYPGSTIKLLDALGLEAWAQGNTEREAMLAGFTVETWNRHGSKYGFNMKSGCYPLDCGNGSIKNFDGNSAEKGLRRDHFGLGEALEKSVNTWFAWLAADMTDKLAVTKGRLYGLGYSLDPMRPIHRIAHQHFRFGQIQLLDGGLIPALVAGEGSVLQASRSYYDTPDRFGFERSLRLQAIGNQVHLTTLKMAEIAGAIATGTPVYPRVLLSINQTQSQASLAKPLNLELGRIRAGMKAVVLTGTAAQAFRPLGNDLRSRIYGKTGTAAVENDENHISFTGFIEGNTLPDQAHPVAFAISVSNSKKHGADAAKVVAGILQSIARKN